MKNLLLILILVMLAGCQKDNIKATVPELPQQERSPDPEAMTQCQKPLPLEDDSFGAVVRKLSEYIGLFDECSGKRDSLQDFIERK